MDNLKTHSKGVHDAEEKQVHLYSVNYSPLQEILGRSRPEGVAEHSQLTRRSPFHIANCRSAGGDSPADHDVPEYELEIPWLADGRILAELREVSTDDVD